MNYFKDLLEWTRLNSEYYLFLSIYELNLGYVFFIEIFPFSFEKHRRNEDIVASGASQIFLNMISQKILRNSINSLLSEKMMTQACRFKNA